MISPYEHAKQKQKAGDFEAAAGLYRAALEADPGDYRALNNLGVVLEILGQSDEAAVVYQQALAIRPDLATIHHGRAPGRRRGTTGLLSQPARPLQPWPRLCREGVGGSGPGSVLAGLGDFAV